MKAKEKEINNELEEFLKNNPNINFMQTPNWAEIKENWKKEFIIVRNKENKITGTMSILLRKVPIINRYIMYAPRGFICETNDKETLEKLTNKAKEIAKKYKAFIFILDPDVTNEDQKFKNIMTDLGYKMKKNIKRSNDVIQPKYLYKLNIKNKNEEEVMKLFSQKTRYNIKLAIKKGVKIREGDIKDINTFFKIMKETGKRDNFYVRKKTYYEKVYKEMSKEHAKILIAEYKNTEIAAAMPIMYGNKVWYLYGGSTNKYRNLMPNYLLQWEMIKLAINLKCETYDFGGISGYMNTNSKSYGVYRFKKGFNGEIFECINELYIIFNPIINFIWNILFKIRKKLIN